MPFAVFRRHQRKLLAIFAILAMAAFVLSDTLVRISSGGSGRTVDPVIVELYGAKYRGADLNEMKNERGNANLFMRELSGLIDRRPIENYFGDLSNRSIVDAVILAHEADKLKMPVGPDVARAFLKKATRGTINKDLFEMILSRFSNHISGEQLLTDIGNQVRIMNVRGLLGRAVITPLDVYETFRAQTERVSARAVGFPVEDFIKQVKDPSDAEVTAYYEKYKDILPDPARDTPGFKIPRQIKVEILSVNGGALEAEFKAKLTEADLRTYYENHKSDFKESSASPPTSFFDDQFPDDLFADDPNAELTPPLIRPFDEVREAIAVTLAAERAHEEIVNRFAQIKDEVIDTFANKYLDAKDDIAEAEKQHKTPRVQLPRPESLKALAEKAKLDYEVTPLLSHEEAEHYGMIGGAEVGLNRSSGGKTFAAEFFDPKVGVFEGVELINSDGRCFLARKIEDSPAHVPTLEEIRAQVVHAWKSEHARPLAEKAAAEFAEKARKDGGKLVGETAAGHAVITTDPMTEMQPSLLPGQMFPFGPPVPSVIPKIPDAGDSLRKALFSLKAGDATVAPNQPRTVYYVLTLNKRDPAKFATLYAPTSDYIRYRLEAANSAQQRLHESWLNELRADAGLKPDWAPPDELKKQTELE